MEGYTTIAGLGTFEYEDRKSIFIGLARPVDTEEEALGFLAAVKKKYPDARHHVYAYVLRENSTTRFSDDHEPQGTAGMPVLDVIRKSGVRNVCVVVTRYFGGTLLGAGGLVRAYSHAASLAIEAAGIITYEPYTELELRCGYSEYQRYSVLLSAASAVIDGVDYAEDVCVHFAVKESEKASIVEKIVETGYGKDVPREVGTRFDYR